MHDVTIIEDVALTSFQPSPTREVITTNKKYSPPERPNLVNILKRGLGRDLFRISVPVVFNEPISFLQRLAEDVEYSYLLDQAAQPSLIGTPERAALVAAFIVSHYSSTADRTAKPFNPLLGETYEFVSHNRNLAVIAEQVRHHPPQSAIHVRGNGWIYHTSHELKNKFLLNTIEVWPEGAVHIHFDDGEHYHYDQARTYVHNILAIGDMWIENSGTITVKEATNKKYITTIQLVQPPPLSFGNKKRVGEVKGNIREISKTGTVGKVVKSFSGNWKRNFNVDGICLWKASARPSSNGTYGFNMTEWAWSLNTKCESNGIGIPAKTDSRFRPDQRALEERQFDTASNEKDRLEQKQRDRRAKAEESNQAYQPRWFEEVVDDATRKKEWKYKGTYFTAKKNAEASWPEDIEDIF